MGMFMTSTDVAARDTFPDITRIRTQQQDTKKNNTRHSVLRGLTPTRDMGDTNHLGCYPGIM